MMRMFVFLFHVTIWTIVAALAFHLFQLVGFSFLDSMLAIKRRK